VIDRLDYGLIFETILYKYSTVHFTYSFAAAGDHQRGAPARLLLSTIHVLRTAVKCRSDPHPCSPSGAFRADWDEMLLISTNRL